MKEVNESTPLPFNCTMTSNSTTVEDSLQLGFQVGCLALTLLLVIINHCQLVANVTVLSLVKGQLVDALGLSCAVNSVIILIRIVQGPLTYPSAQLCLHSIVFCWTLCVSLVAWIYVLKILLVLNHGHCAAFCGTYTTSLMILGVTCLVVLGMTTASYFYHSEVNVNSHNLVLILYLTCRASNKPETMINVPFLCMFMVAVTSYLVDFCLGGDSRGIRLSKLKYLLVGVIIIMSSMTGELLTSPDHNFAKDLPFSRKYLQQIFNQLVLISFVAIGIRNRALNGHATGTGPTAGSASDCIKGRGGRRAANPFLSRRGRWRRRLNGRRPPTDPGTVFSLKESKRSSVYKMQQRSKRGPKRRKKNRVYTIDVRFKGSDRDGSNVTWATKSSAKAMMVKRRLEDMGQEVKMSDRSITVVQDIE